MSILSKIMFAIYRKRAIWGEFSWVVIGQAASVLGAIVGVKLLTGALPPSIYGELALAMTAATLMNQTILGPLSNSFTRFYAPAAEAGELGTYLGSVARLTGIGSVIVISVAFAAIVGITYIGHAAWVPLLGATLAFAIVSGSNSIMDGIQTAARHRSVVALHQGAASWLRFLSAVGFVWAFGITSTVAMWGYCLGSLFVIVSQAYFFERRVVRNVNSPEWLPAKDSKLWRRRMYEYAWPFSLWGVATWLQFSSDRWAIQLFGNTQDVGLYAVLYQLGFYPLMLLSGVVSQLVAPLFFQLAGDGSDDGRKAQVARRNRQMTFVALGICTCCVAGAAGLHTWVFRLLTAEEYRSVSWLLPAVALSGGLFGTAQLSVLGLLSNHDSSILLKPKLCTAFFGIALNFVGAAFWNLPGVVMAGILANGIYLLWVIRLNVALTTNANSFPINSEINSSPA